VQMSLNKDENAMDGPFELFEEENFLTPSQIVAELDKYVIGQSEAKRAVAIALRNRWRRRQVHPDLREEIMPNNIVMIGATGVGKTEIARRLARLANAPFIKVEASKFTEVGYVGRDVESIIRDLTELAVSMVRQEKELEVEDVALKNVEEKLLDLLLPPLPKKRSPKSRKRKGGYSELQLAIEYNEGSYEDEDERLINKWEQKRLRLKDLLAQGRLEGSEVEIELNTRPMPFVEVLSPMGFEDLDTSIIDMLEDVIPRKKKKRKVPVQEARRLLMQEEVKKLIDLEEIVQDAIERVEDTGIVFIDEVDKITGSGTRTGPDVSREGVQRDLLPIIEGSNVPTKYGLVATDHILFIAAGAFHESKPSNLLPEMQGRFPIRVELDKLGELDFVRILVEPKNALIKQYTALLRSEGAEIDFRPDGITEIARVASMANERMENIGARRLHTVLTILLDEVLFSLPESGVKNLVIDRQYVAEKLHRVVEDKDLRRYIL
jgi:ATP-dependent HslUV protease ATP-binding subunit HslU